MGYIAIVGVLEVITAIATAIYFTQAGHGTPGRQTSESSGGETHCVGAQHPLDKWQKQQWTTEGPPRRFVGSQFYGGFALREQRGVHGVLSSYSQSVSGVIQYGHV